MAPPPLAAGAPSPAAPRVPPGRLLGAGHGRLALAAAGAAATRAHPALALFALPYAAEALSRRGPGARARAVALAKLPGQVSAGVAELATYAIGSARHRTLVL